MMFAKVLGGTSESGQREFHQKGSEMGKHHLFTSACFTSFFTSLTVDFLSGELMNGSGKATLFAFFMEGWISYHFFTRVNHPDIVELHNIDITAACSCCGSLLFGTRTGEIFALQNLDSPVVSVGLSFNGPVIHIESAQFSQRLLIITQEESFYFFRIYGYQDFNLRYELRVESQTGLHCITTSAKMTRIGFTLNRRDVLLYTLPKVDKPSSKPQKLSSKPSHSIAHQSEVTAIFLANDATFKKYLFVATRNTVYSYEFALLGAVRQFTIDEEGYSPPEGHRTAVIDSKGHLVLCRQGTVSTYTRRTKLEKEYVLDPEPTLLYWYRTYFVTATRASVPTSLKIYDPQTHCIFGVGKCGITTKFVLPEWGKLNILLDDGTLVTLTEPDTETKIQLLCGKFDQYDVALALAKSQKLGPSIVASIHRNKGDTNYDKHKFAEAIREYTQAIGSLEPSYVIRRFLDPEHAHYLIDYLEELLRREASANAAAKKLQTKLLFNCYTKLRRTDAIREAIEETLAAVLLGSEPLFDVPTAVEVLNRGGYADQARELASSFQEHAMYLRLLLDAGDYGTMADYITTLATDVAASAIVAHGSALMDHLDDAKQREFAANVVRLSASVDPNQFRPVFALHPEIYFVFLQELAAADDTKLSQFLWDDFVQCAVAVAPDSLPAILANPAARFSTEQALIILRECWARDPAAPVIRAALRCLYERRAMFFEILAISEPAELLPTCEAYSDRCPGLWREAIKQAIAAKDMAAIRALVDRVLDRRIMTFNNVLPLLSKTTFCIFEIIQPFAIAGLEQLAEQVREREERLARLDAEIEKNERMIDQMTEEYFAVKPGLCHLCGLKLDAPCRYFRV
jgi:tetratricopeptide (TPR) repeat protein